MEPAPMEPRPPKSIGIGDADLVAAALEGDRFAQDALYRRHGPRATRLAVRLLGSYAEAEDVLHDSFLEAFTKLEQLRDPSAFPAWLMQIVAMKARQRLRKRALLRRFGLRSREEEDATLEELASEEASPEQRAELSLIDDVLREVAADDRVVWVLCRVEGYTIAEAAAMCGTSLNTAKRRLARVDSKVDVLVKWANKWRGL